MSSLSVSIIMKNEEGCIARCLSTVSKFADEIIVVDTGSTDKSKEIAATFSRVKLFDSEYFNKDTHFSDFEFGKAKNEAIKKCTKDWLLWWDADDYIDEENINKILGIINTEKNPCLFSFDISYGFLRFEHCRLFKNNADIFFDETHACHEYLNTNGFPLYIRKDVVIQHLPEHKTVSSSKRNIAIMEKDYYRRKRQDPRTMFYLANGYREDGQYDKAIDFYDKYLQVSNWNEERYFARYYKAQCLFRSGKLEESRNEVLRSLTEDFRFAESFCFLGDVAFYFKDYEKAILWYKMALSTPYPKDARLFVSRYSYSDYPTAKIGECLSLVGETGQLAQVVQPVQPEANPEAKEVTKRICNFTLPEDKGLAMIAAMVFSNCVNKGLADISVFVKDDWQRALMSKFAKISLSNELGAKISLPSKLKEKHLLEWVSRSSGFYDLNIDPVIINGDFENPRDTILLQNVMDSPVLERVKMLNGGKRAIAMVSEDGGFDETVSFFMKGSIFIGNAGWLQHLAQWFNIPAFIVMGDKNFKEYSWGNQENVPTMVIPKLESFYSRSQQW
jgi:glycosyltransferase involved in cell wall biosynthesis